MSNFSFPTLVPIKKIFVWDKNPRFFPSENIDFSNIEIGYIDDKLTIFELLKNEAKGEEIEIDDENIGPVQNVTNGKKINYEDFLLLCKSLIISNFLDDDDNVYVKKIKNGDKYIVLEGNRRISAIKILKNWNNWKMDISKIFSNAFSNKIDNLIKNYKDNYERLISIDEIPTRIVNENANSEDIWNIIYARHNNKKIGKSKWFRIKYLKDVAFHFNKIKKNYINYDLSSPTWFFDLCEKIHRILNKDPKSVVNDVQASLWVTHSLKITNVYSEEEQRNLKISAFEISMSHIKDPKDPTMVLNKLFKIKFNFRDWNFEISSTGVSEVKIDKHNQYILIDFLLKSYKEKKYSTRGWNLNDEDLYDLLKFLHPDIKIAKKKIVDYSIEEVIKNHDNRNFIEQNKINIENILKIKGFFEEYKISIYPKLKNVLFELTPKLLLLTDKIVLSKKTDNVDASFIIFVSCVKALQQEQIKPEELSPKIKINEFPFSKYSMISRSFIEKIFLVLIVNPSSRQILILNKIISPKFTYIDKYFKPESIIDTEKGKMIAVDDKWIRNVSLDDSDFYDFIKQVGVDARYKHEPFNVAARQFRTNLQKNNCSRILMESFNAFLESCEYNGLIKFSKIIDLSMNNFFTHLWDNSLPAHITPEDACWFGRNYYGWTSMMAHWDLYLMHSFEIINDDKIKSWIEILISFHRSLFELMLCIKEAL